jgi:hypothetical protein
VFENAVLERNDWLRSIWRGISCLPPRHTSEICGETQPTRDGATSQGHGRRGWGGTAPFGIPVFPGSPRLAEFGLANPILLAKHPRIPGFQLNARAFHRHMAAACGEQPGAQAEQLSGSGAEGPYLLLHFPAFSQPSTSRPPPWPDAHPIHIRGSTRVRLTPPWGGDCCAAGLLQTLSCVLPVSDSASHSRQ